MDFWLWRPNKKDIDIDKAKISDTPVQEDAMIDSFNNFLSAGLGPKSTENYDCSKLELSGSWPPPGNSCSS